MRARLAVVALSLTALTGCPPPGTTCTLEEECVDRWGPGSICVIPDDEPAGLCTRPCRVESTTDCEVGEVCVDGLCYEEGTVDAGPDPDAGPSVDAGPQDAGPQDAGLQDAGPEDAGPQDAGFDAGPEDAGFDAGPAPTITLMLDDSTVNDGTMVTATWTSSDATSCELTLPGVAAQTIALNDSTSFTAGASGDVTVSCDGPGGSDSATEALQVARIVSFDSDVELVGSDDPDVELTWVVENVTACAVDGEADPAGATVLLVQPVATTNYTLRCTGFDSEEHSAVLGSDVRVVRVLTFTAGTANPVRTNTAVTLSWTSAEADDCELDSAVFAADGNSNVTPLVAVTTTTHTLVCSSGTATATDTYDITTNSEWDGDITFTSGTPDLSAYAGVTEVFGEVNLADTGLTTLAGLESLSVVNGQLRLVNNDSLTDVTALSSVQTVTGVFRVANHDVLETAGFGTLFSVGSNFIISANGALNSIRFGSLDTISGDFTITNNSSLPTSQATDLQSQVEMAGGIGGTPSVSGNM